MVYCFGLALLRSVISEYMLATYSTKKMQNQNQLWLGHVRFPTLRTGYMHQWFNDTPLKHKLYIDAMW